MAKVKAIRGRKALRTHVENGGCVMKTRTQVEEVRAREHFCDPVTGATVSAGVVHFGLQEGWLAPRNDGLFDDSQTYGAPA